MSHLLHVFSLDPSRRAHALRFALLLLVKVALFALFLADNARTEHMGSLALRDGDTWEYVDPIESLLAGKGYDPDHRMPGYGAVWLLLRSVLSYSAAASAITVIQLLLASLVVYLLAWSVYRLTASRLAFWITYGLLAISTFHAKVEPWVMNESFTTSAIALHWIGFLRWKRESRVGWLMFSGAMLGWAVFMRPIYAPLLAVVPLLLFVKRSAYWRERLLLPVVFLLPFALADVPWILRNARVNQAFHPLTNGVYGAPFMASPYYAGIKLVQSYGGNYNFWDPSAGIRWFGFRERDRPGIAQLANTFDPPPAYAVIPGYGMDSLQAFADLIAITRDTTATEEARSSAARSAHRIADGYRAAYAGERPFQYYIMAPLRYLKHITVHSGTSVLFNRSFRDMPPWQKAFKLGQSALYWAVLVCGACMAIVRLVRRNGNAATWLLAVLVLYGILSHPFLMRVCEIRYLVPTYPVMLVAAVLLFHPARGGRLPA